MRGIDDPDRVGAWIVDHVPDTSAPFTFELIAGGRSNLTFKLVDAAGRRLVLRRPPLGHVLATAHDMAREHRLISAVGRTDVPVPPALGLCTDEAVNGAPFYMMEFVDGEVLDSAEKAAVLAPEVRRAAALDLIDVLAALHAVDVDAVGLGDLARRDGYVERQLKRWSTQWVNSKTRELPAVEEVEHGLRKQIPPQQGSAIVHGDYRLGNCLTDPVEGRINAVLDWELCTLGDPLADVGYLGVYWSDEGALPRRSTDPTAAGGFPTYAEIIERYAQRTGRDVSEIAYYRAFAAFRLAVISEGVYARYLHGQMADDGADIAMFKRNVEDLAEGALQALREL
ncbi:MAG TPA: phosphotransferase family protein [Acidimicrobiales bacterium]